MHICIHILSCQICTRLNTTTSAGVIYIHTHVYVLIHEYTFIADIFPQLLC